MATTRLDQALIARALCDSREKAKRLILAGQVRVNGQSARKPSDSVKPGDTLTLDAPEKFVSRGGHKLEHALEHFQIVVTGLTAIDLGASTGGFTDCLLQRGAEKVFAVDVGQGQLAWKLRQDKRVVVMEKTNARFLTCKDFTVRAPATPSPLGGEMAGVRGEQGAGLTTIPTAPKQNHPSPSIPLPSEGRGKRKPNAHSNSDPLNSTEKPPPCPPQIKAPEQDNSRSGVVAFNRLLFLAALGAAGFVLAAFRARRRVFAATAVALDGGFAAGFVLAGRATGGHQDSCGKNRSQDHH